MKEVTSVDLPGIQKLRSGKVREVFDLGKDLLFVATDRISAFDCILPDPIPGKGAVLNTISAFWFQKFHHVRNHFVTADFTEFPEQLQPHEESLRDRSIIVRDLSLALYSDGSVHAARNGIIVADTKFEFGIRDDALLLIDECLTPDSSRFWPADLYETGSSPVSYDKQFVRDYLETLDWDRTPPAPSLPPQVIAKTSEKYQEALERLVH